MAVVIEIQGLTAGGREKWATERRFGDHLVHACPVSYIDLVWDQILSMCPGRSWRMVQMLAEGGEIVLHGPTTAVTGEPWGPAPGRSLLPPLRFKPFPVSDD